MPYQVTTSARATVQLNCSACAHRWNQTSSASHTSGLVWRRGVQGAADSARETAEAMARANASMDGHICGQCGHLSTQALATVFGNGLAKGMMEIYDGSLDKAQPSNWKLGLMVAPLLAIAFPWVGGALFAVSLPLYLRSRQRIKQCTALRENIASTLAALETVSVATVQELAVRCAKAGLGRYTAGSFDLRLSWCWTLVNELRQRKLLGSQPSPP